MKLHIDGCRYEIGIWIPFYTIKKYQYLITMSKEKKIYIPPGLTDGIRPNGFSNHAKEVSLRNIALILFCMLDESQVLKMIKIIQQEREGE